MNRKHMSLFALSALATALAIGASVYYASTLDTTSPPPPASVTSDANLPLPRLFIPPVKSVTSDVASRDPMRVMDYSGYPTPGTEREQLHAKWKLRGIANIGKEIIKVPKTNPDGTDSGETEAKEVEVWAAFFADNPRFYRVGDRLEETHFTVSAIHFDSESAYVEVEGDLGTREKLPPKTK